MSPKAFGAEVPRRVESPLLHYWRFFTSRQSLVWYQRVEPGECFVSGLVEALAQAIPFRVQHHSKPRFGWAVVQEKSHGSKGLCLLRDVAAHAVHGIAWDVGVDFWGTCL